MLFQGGGFRQLGVQALALLTIGVWTVIVSFIILKFIQMTLGLRVSLEEEIIGADIIEHGIGKRKEVLTLLFKFFLPSYVKQKGHAS